MATVGLYHRAIGRICRSKPAIRCYSKSLNEPRLHSHIFKIAGNVREALESGQPVVALESTIYTHGFPNPENIALANDLESIVIKNGATPATIGILDGVAIVGLSKDELAKLASSAGKPETMKVSRRDLPYILGMGMTGHKIIGGTTISGTMFLAVKAGIKVFGTGGLGGVHRGGQDTMDISADLTELGRTPVAVVSSGCKSFLDLQRTLEYLETQGAGVFTFADGRKGDVDFPSFYTRDSGVRGPMVIQTAKQAASIIYSQSIFQKSSGLLFGNPIPEEFSIPKEEIDIAINQAVQEAAEQGIHGHANTPFILKRIKELTEGRSIPANRALIESNVLMATKIAVELAAMRKILIPPKTQSLLQRMERRGRTYISPEVVTKSAPKNKPVAQTKPIVKHSKLSPPTQEADILVFGGVAIDSSCDHIPASKEIGNIEPKDLTPKLHTSNIASIATSVGGVGHNVTLAIHNTVGSRSMVRLGSLVGKDLAGETVLHTMQQEGLITAGIVKCSSDVRTAQYIAINDGQKDLMLAMADMAIFDGPECYEYVNQHEAVDEKVKWVVVDANWKRQVAWMIMKKFSAKGAKIAFEPVSVKKSAAVFCESKGAKDGGKTHLEHSLGIFPKNKIDLTTPNHHELAAMHAAAKDNGYFETERWWAIVDALGIPSSGARDRFVALTNQKMTDDGIPLQSIQLLPIIPTILTKLGADGVLLTELLKPDDQRLTDPDSAPYILSRCTNGSTEVGGVYMRLFPAVEEVNDVVSVNGVGDTFLGVLIAGLARGLQLDEGLINIAQKGAVMTLRSAKSVSPELASIRQELDSLVTEKI